MNCQKADNINHCHRQWSFVTQGIQTNTPAWAQYIYLRHKGARFSCQFKWQAHSNPPSVAVQFRFKPALISVTNKHRRKKNLVINMIREFAMRSSSTAASCTSLCQEKIMGINSKTEVVHEWPNAMKWNRTLTGVLDKVNTTIRSAIYARNTNQ